MLLHAAVAYAALLGKLMWPLDTWPAGAVLPVYPWAAAGEYTDQQEGPERAGHSRACQLQCACAPGQDDAGPGCSLRLINLRGWPLDIYITTRDSNGINTSFACEADAPRPISLDTMTVSSTCPHAGKPCLKALRAQRVLCSSRIHLHHAHLTSHRQAVSSIMPRIVQHAKSVLHTNEETA